MPCRGLAAIDPRHPQRASDLRCLHTMTYVNLGEPAGWRRVKFWFIWLTRRGWVGKFV